MARWRAASACFRDSWNDVSWHRHSWPGSQIARGTHDRENEAARQEMGQFRGKIRSRNGNNITTRSAVGITIVPIISRSPGNSLSIWNSDKKYHSGRAG